MKYVPAYYRAWRALLFSAIVSSMALMSAPSSSQDSQSIMNLFGAILNSAVQEGARAEWANISPREVACIDAVLSRQGESLRRVIDNGIPPNDPRLSGIRATCAKVSETRLRHNVECPIKGPDGEFISWCDEDFAQQSDDGSYSKVRSQDALQSSSSDQGFTTALFERADAKSRRSRMLADAITSGRVPIPNFDCAKARTNTELAICNSYILSALDTEYGGLYQRTRPFDKQGLTRTEARRRYLVATACDGSEPCIKENVINGINFMAKFLRQNKQTVAVTLDQKKDLTAKADAQRQGEEAAEKAIAAQAETQRQQKEAAERVAAAQAAAELRQQEAAQRAAVAEAEAKRQQEEADQKAAVARVKAEEDRQKILAYQAREKLSTAVAVARQLIEEGSAFLKFDRNNSNTLDIAENIALANAAVKTVEKTQTPVKADDVEQLDAAISSLSKVIHQDTGFADFMNERAAKQAQDNARRLKEATDLAANQKAFLRSYVSQNPTADASAVFIGGVKTLESMLSHGTPSVSELAALTEKINGVIIEYKLHDEFVASLAHVSTPEQQEESEKVRGISEQLMQEASAFLISDPTNPNTLQIAEALASLNAALKSDDSQQIEVTTAALSRAVHEDSRFAGFTSERATAEAEDNALHLSAALKLAKQQRDFLLSYIARHPTDASSAAFIGHVRNLEIGLSATAPSLSQLRSLSDRIAASIGQADLRDDFLASLNAKADTTSGAKLIAPAFQGLVTDQTDFLLRGDLQDVVLLFNASQQSPHVVKNLRGDIVFNGDEATGCFYQKAVDPELVETVRSSLAKNKLRTLTLGPIACKSDHLLDYDIIAVRRGDFLREDPEYVSALVKEVQSLNYKPLTQVSGQESQAAIKVLSTRREQIERDISDDTIDGYGLVVLTSISSPTVCAAVLSSDQAHQTTISSLTDHLTGLLGMTPAAQFFDSGEEAFAAVQHNKCGAVYGSAVDLKGLISAFKREKTPYQLDVSWILPGQIAELERQAAENSRIYEQQQMERRRKGTEDRELQALREKDEAANKEVQQFRLREQNGPIANAAAASIASEIRASIAKPEASDLTDQFQEFGTWYWSMIKDHWELMSFNSELSDYGQVRFKTRELQAVLTKVSIRLRNQIRGEYEDACYLFGRVIDDEFRMSRQLIGIACDDAQALTSWKEAQSFQSQWSVD